MMDLLATVENHTSNILMIINNEGQMVWATESYTRSLGYSRADDNAFLTNIHSEDQPAFQEAVNRAFAGESPELADAPTKERWFLGPARGLTYPHFGGRTSGGGAAFAPSHRLD